MTVSEGSSITQIFVDAGTSYGSVNACGSRTFIVEDSSGIAVPWISIDHSYGSIYLITAAPTNTENELQKTLSLHLKIVSNDYSAYQSSITVNFKVTVLPE